MPRERGFGDTFDGISRIGISRINTINSERKRVIVNIVNIVIPIAPNFVMNASRLCCVFRTNEM